MYIYIVCNLTEKKDITLKGRIMPNQDSIFKYLYIFYIFFCAYQVPFAQESNNKIWVKFEKDLLVPISENGKLFSSSNEFQSSINKYKLTNFKKAFPNSKKSELLKVYEIDFIGKESDVIQSLSKVEGISYIEIAPKIEALYTPNDYNLKFSVDYALDIVNAKNAWDISMGDSSIIIGVSDTNYDTNSIELNGQYTYIDEYIFDTDYLHGTAVANQIAGKTDNNYGKSSIAPKCKLRLYSMGYNSLLQACYEGVKVINASWASGCNYSYFGQQICDEIYNQGVILVAAAGNGGTCGGANNLVYPSAFNHVISVTSIGASDNHEKIIGNSNTTHQHNATVDLSAPGYFVPLAANNNTFITANGSSFAAPIVTGAIGLILSVNPCLTADQVEDILKNTARNIDNLNPNYAGKIGAGRIDIYEALKLAKTITSIRVTDTIIFNCEKQSATIDLFPLGGTSPYDFIWQNGRQGSHQENVISGNYVIDIKDSKGCLSKDTIEVKGIQVNYDYTNNVSVTNSNFNLTDLNSDGIIRIGGKLIIEPNINFEINDKKIQFGKGPNEDKSGILIENGASLKIKNHTILMGLNQCKSRWDGIEISDNKELVIDTSNNSQTFVKHDKSGELIMDKSSVFDAFTAIKTIQLDHIDTNTLFGSITITNSLFHDNQNGIDLSSNNKSNLQKNNIIDCIFIVDDSLIKNTQHLKLKNVNNLQIIKNGFFGNKYVFENEKGTGIESVNSNLFIASDTTSDVTKINNTKGNDFYDLFYGINSTNPSNKINVIQITGSNFKYVNQGININGKTNGLIYKNEFFLPSGSMTNKSFGINCENDNEIIISENTLSTLNKEQQNNYGIILKNSTYSLVKIYKNNFNGTFKAANYFEGDNLNTNIDCNNYLGDSEHAWEINSGKLKNQDGLDQNGKAYVYLNNFEKNTKKESQIYIHTNAENIIYQTTIDFTPTNISPSVMVAIINDNIHENGCLNYFELKQLIPEKPVDSLLYSKSNIYPNPTFNGTTSITWNELTIDKIEIFNLLGEIILEKKVNGKNGIQSFTNLPLGTFFVKLSNNNEIVITKKLIVN